MFDLTGVNKLQQALDCRYEGLIAWVYSTLVNTSGLLSGPEEDNHPPMNMIPGRDRAVGFRFPKQMSKLMMAETEDWITVLAPALSPIIGYMMVLRYPTQPLKMVAHGHKYCIIVSFIKQWEQGVLTNRIPTTANWSTPMAFTMLKTPEAAREDLEMRSPSSSCHRSCTPSIGVRTH